MLPHVTCIKTDVGNEFPDLVHLMLKLVSRVVMSEMKSDEKVIFFPSPENELLYIVIKGLNILYEGSL